MTAEERMAYFQGEKRRTAADSVSRKEKDQSLIFFKLRFFIAVVLFIAFLSLDYTGYQVRGIGSKELMELVTTDQDLSVIRSLKDSMTKA